MPVSPNLLPSYNLTSEARSMVLTATILFLLLAGCSSRKSATDAAAPTAPTGPWFCEPAIVGEGWDCTNDPERVANPRPSQPLARVLAARDAAEAQAQAAARAEAAAEAQAAIAASLDAAGDSLMTAGSVATASAQGSAESTEPGPVTAGKINVDPADRSDTAAARTAEPVAAAGSGDPAAARDAANAAAFDEVADDATGGAEAQAMSVERAETPAEEPAYARLAYRPEQPVSLLELPPDFYAVQIIALSSTEELERFFDRLGVNELTAAEVEVDGELRYALLLGIYETLAAAEQAAANPPEALMSYDPWIRRLAGLQADMLRAERLRQ